ncbi:MAG: hypothetical protein H6739_28180 [Alphaproteobacteria bacterium]|nr:hypothetical protein [Alphaproteobacteria bacterium]
MLPVLLALITAALAQDSDPSVRPSADAQAFIREALDPHALHLDACLTQPPAAAKGPKVTSWPSGQVVLQVKVRRGAVTVVTTSSTDPGLEWLQPCLERELAEVTWPVQRGELEVPLEVEAATPEDKAELKEPSGDEP